MHSRLAAVLRVAMIRLVITACIALLAAGGCSGGGSDGVPPHAIASSPSRVAPVAMPEVDLDAVMRNAHFRFRSAEGAFVYDDRAYGVRRDGDGLSFTPHGGTPLRFDATRIARGSRDVELKGHARLESDGTLAIGESVVEHLRNSDDGCEQSWSFASKPAGTGPLTVRIAARGLAHVASTKTGLHFAARDTHLGVRYGHATFVDAVGRRTHVEAKWTGTDIVLSVPADVLDSAAYPATLDPTIGPETAVDTPLFMDAPGSHTRPKVAAGGGEFLVVWADDRAGTFDILGARITTAGAVLDTVGIPIVAAAGNQTTVNIAFDGTNFVVVWNDYRSGSAEVWAARVSPAGVVLDTGVKIAASGATSPAIACDGTNCLIAWLESSIRGIRVDSTLTPVDSGSFYIPAGTSAPAIAFDGTRYLVVATTSTTIRGARVSTAGAVLDPSGLKIGAGSVAEAVPAIATDRSSMFMVVWEAQKTSGDRDIYGARVAGGTVLDPTNIAIATTAGSQQANPTIAYDGANFLVLWDDYTGTLGNASVAGIRVTTAGTVFDSAPVTFAPLSAPSPKLPAIAHDGTRALAVWQGYGKLFPGIFGARISGLASLDTPAFRITSAAHEQRQPAMAWDGTQWLVAWADRRNDFNFEIYATRLSKSGTVLDPSGIEVCRGVNGRKDPAVASNGSGFYVVWVDSRSFTSSIYGTPVTSSGVVSYPNGKQLVANVSAPPALASDGANYALVVDGVRAYPFAADGTLLLAGGFAVSSSGGAPSVIYVSPRYWITWSEATTVTNIDVWVRSMTSAGAMGSAVRVTGAAGNQNSPAIAFDGSGFLVAWSDSRDGDWNIYGSRLSPDGVVGDPFGIAITKATGDQLRPRLIFDGFEYLAAWHDGRGSDVDIYATRLNTAGVVLDPTGIVLANGAGDEQDMKLVAGANGEALLAYKRYSTALSNQRVFVRRIGATVPSGTACLSSADCAGRPCVDGVCCDTTCGSGVTTDCQACSVAAGAAVNGTCGPVRSGTVCRAAAGGCDVAETCNGTSITCPADVGAIEGSSCDDGLVCNGVSTCKMGVCTAGMTLSCDDGDPCTVDTCAEPTGCVHTPGTCADAAVDVGTDAADSAAPVVDSTPADGATELDTGTDDSAVIVDSATPDADVAPPPPGEDSGCGCSVPGVRGATPASLFLLAIVALRRSLRRRLRALTLATIVAAGCGVGDRSAPPAPAAAPVASDVHPSVATGVDFEKLFDNAHYAFRPSASGLTMRDRRYDVTANVSGLTFVPHQPRIDGREVNPFVLETPRISRGAMAPGSASAAPRIEEDGHLARECAADVVEELRNSELGVEQSWRFAKAPDGKGDLSVRIAARGQSFLSVTDSGLHFTDSGSDVGVRYGHATWIDNRGMRTSVNARWDGRDIVLTVPAAVVDGAAYPAVLDPIVSPEFAVDDPVYVIGRGARPKVAAGGGQFLVVWQENRGTDIDVYGARVSSAGTLLDKTGFAISTATGHQSEPRVAFDGTNFLVVWNDARAASSVYGARVKSDGTVLDPSGVVLAAGSGTVSKSVSDIAFDGTNYILALNQSTDVYAARVAKDLTILDPNGFVVASAANYQQNAAVAFDGTNYLFAFQDSRDTNAKLRGARVSPAGAVLDPATFVISTAPGRSFYPDVASNGTGFLVTWMDEAATSPYDDNIYAARVSSAGVVLDTTNIPIAISTTSKQTDPTVSFNGTDYVIAWTENSPTPLATYATRVSTSGTVVDSAPTRLAISARNQMTPASAYDGSQVFIVWTGIEGVRLSGMTVLDSPPVKIALTTNEETAPAIAFDGTRALAVWVDSRSFPSYQVYAARLTPTGTTLDPAGIPLDTVDRFEQASVATNGTRFLVAYAKAPFTGANRQIHAVRIASSDGSVLDSTPLSLSASSGDEKRAAVVASDGTDFFVAWVGYGVGLAGARVGSDGSLNAPIVIKANGDNPAITHGGGSYLVAFDVSSLTTGTDVYAARISSAGALVDTAPFLISGVSGSQSRPSMTFDGTRFFIVWSDGRTPSGLYGARVSTAASVLDPSGIFIANMTNLTQYKVAFDGIELIAVWEDTGGPSGSADIHATRITTAGVVKDPAPFAIAEGESAERRPAIAGLGAAKSMVLYSHTIIDTTFLSARVRGRIIDNTPPTPCTSASACTSGFCVDGFCCDTACGGGVTTDCLVCSIAAGGSDDGRCSIAKVRTVCRPAVGPCDIAEICNGIGPSCPGNAFAADGLSCDDGLVCNGVAKCSSGACVPGSASCDDGDVCTTDSCSEPTGCNHVRITGCDAGVPTDAGTDASVTDSGSDTADAADSSVADTLIADSSIADTAMPETTATDSSATDSGGADTAVAMDTSADASSDAEPDTAAMPDTASELDSAAPIEDSMPPADDAAADDAGAPIDNAADSGGCGCTIPGTSRAMEGEAAVLALLLITARYRRRRASR